MGLVPTAVTAFTLDAFTSFPSGQDFIVLRGSSASGENSVTVDASGLNTSETFSGSRRVKLTQVSPANSSGAFFFGRDADNIAEFAGNSSFAARTDIIWNGFEGSESGSGNYVDIEELDGSDMATQFSFQINIKTLDTGQESGDGNIQLNFDIIDTAGNSGTISRLITSDLNDANLYFPYRGDTQTSSDVVANGVNLQEINYIRFYTGSENLADDFEFNFIQSSQFVPFEFSPGLGLLLSGSMVGFLKLKNRRKINSK